MALSSKVFTSDAKIKTRLQRCQDNDRDHVMPGDRGDHVSAIQTALFTLLPKLELPNDELSDPKTKSGWYGPKTAAAVAEYKRKHKPQILNHRGAIDQIVGKQTITYMDKELPSLPGADPVTPPSGVVLDFIDIAIRVQGYDNEGQAGLEVTNADVTAGARSEFGYAANGRKLWLIFFNGGSKEKDPTDQILQKFSQARTLGRSGRVTLDGGSAGGSVVVGIAKQLTSENIRIDYIGVWDGAFQMSDLENSSFDVRSGEPADIRTPVINASEKDNWFQSFGNTLVPDQEIHGRLKGFNNKSLDKLASIAALKLLPTSIDSVRQKAADTAHTLAYQFGRERAQQRVRQIMAAKP